MSFKNITLLALISGLLAAIASVIFNKIYTEAFYVDFSSIISITGIIASTLFGTILMSLGYWLFLKVFKSKGIFLYHLIIVILSFITIIGPLAAELPHEIDYPELFPGLTIPMHFFPVLAWLACKPLVEKKY